MEEEDYPSIDELKAQRDKPSFECPYCGQQCEPGHFLIKNSVGSSMLLGLSSQKMYFISHDEGEEKEVITNHEKHIGRYCENCGTMVIRNETLQM